MQRLENKAEQSMSVQGEYERMRSMRVDDAVMIENLRGQLGEVVEAINEIVGTLAAFSGAIEAKELNGQDTLKELILRMRPLKSTDEIISSMRDIRQIISYITVLAKSMPSKDQSPLELSPPQKEDRNLPMKDEFRIRPAPHDQSNKHQMETLEEQLNNHKLYIIDLEAILKNACNLRSLDP